MKDFDIIVTRKNELCSDNFFLTSKSYNAYKFTFNFVIPWNKELKLQAIFKAPYQQSVAIDLDDTNSCVVPYEVTTKPGILKVGLRGIKLNEDSIPTKYSNTPYNIIENTPYMFIPIVRGAI